MAVRSFLPDRDSALLAWSLNFKSLITATPTAYGLTAEQASVYDALHEAYATALAAADPSIRNKPATATKNVRRAMLKTQARLLAGLIEHTVSVSDAQKLELGLTVRKPPTPVPAPSASPNIDIVSVNGRSVKVRLHGDEPGRRGRPAGVQGASVFSYVGEQPTDDISAWKFEGSTTRTRFDVEFPATVQPGTKV